MPDEHGVPAHGPTDQDLERQGVLAHGTPHWVLLHGAAEQFRTHTQGMLELAQEYLHGYPPRTRQASGGAEPGAALPFMARDARIRDLIHALITEVLSLLDESGVGSATGEIAAATVSQARLLAAFAGAPGRSLDKLEAHQIARTVAPNAVVVAGTVGGGRARQAALGGVPSLSSTPRPAR